jgi:hypothetical protein
MLPFFTKMNLKRLMVMILGQETLLWMLGLENTNL